MQRGDADDGLVDKWLASLRARRSHAGKSGKASGKHESVVPDAEDEVLAVLLDDSDPGRGWSLATRMLEQARDDFEVREIAINVLETLLREKGDALADLLRASVRTDQRWREALRHIYLSGKAADVARAEGLYDHPDLSDHNGHC